MATSPATIERTPLLDSLGQLRLIGERFEEFVSRQYDELEALRNGLARREGELVQQQSQLDELRHLNELRAQQFEEQAARLDQLTVELAEVRSELNNARQQVAAPRRDEEDALRRRVEEMERERRDLQAELARACEQAARQAAATAELDQLRAELESALDAGQTNSRLRAELDRAQRELAEAREELSDPPRTATVAGEAFVEDELQLRLQAVERERDELAAELESILGRSAALAENAARERRKAAEERGEWESELKTLRRALAAQLQAHTDTAHGPRLPARSGGGRNGRHGTDKAGSQEAVIDSVIAQFAALKKTTGRSESVIETVAAARE